MSLSKDLRKYPAEFFDLAERMQRVRSVDVPLQRKGGAQALRFRLYGFKRALELSGMGEQYPNFMGSELVIEGSTLRIRMPEDISIVGALRQALEAPSEARPNPDESSGALTGRIGTQEPQMQRLPRAREGNTKSEGPPLSTEPRVERSHAEDAVAAFLTSGVDEQLYGPCHCQGTGLCTYEKGFPACGSYKDTK